MKSRTLSVAWALLVRLTLAHSAASAAPTPEQTTTPQPQTKKALSAWDRYRLTADRHAVIGDALAHKALSYRGVRYRFGGTTTHGIDCSGLTQAVYRKCGLLLPRTSTEQFGKGVPVSKDQLQPGDLVFFQNTYRRGISHVGIYIGEGKFVHAANHKKGVTVSPLSDPYYEHHYAGARRIALDSNAPVHPDAATEGENAIESDVQDRPTMAPFAYSPWREERSSAACPPAAVPCPAAR